MKENSRIVRYNVEFWKLAARVDWNDAALRECYFRGLPLRLRTEVIRGGKPTSLGDLRLKAQECDEVFWMQKNEASLETKTKPTPPTKDPPKPNSTPSQNSQNKSNDSNKKPNNQNNKSENSDKPRDTKHLGKDGRLTTEERNRRIKEGLCLYCGQKGHNAKDCKKSQAARARAAMVSEESSAPTASSDAASKN